MNKSMEINLTTNFQVLNSCCDGNLLILILESLINLLKVHRQSDRVQVQVSEFIAIWRALKSLSQLHICHFPGKLGLGTDPKDPA